MVTDLARERKQNFMMFKFRDAYKAGTELNLKNFLSSFCLEMYCSYRYARELLKIFEDSGRIKIVKGRIEVLK